MLQGGYLPTISRIIGTTFAVHANICAAAGVQPAPRSCTRPPNKTQ